MSPPEVWGPAIWTLFHTLADKINPEAYPIVIKSMFPMIINICKFLPCPDCSIHASNFLAKVDINKHKNKEDFKILFYLFHNSVNARKKKKLFPYSDIGMYSKYNLVNVVRNFILKYNTTGNMKLLTESFQRKLIIGNFIKWFQQNSNAFIEPKIEPNIEQVAEITNETNETNANTNNNNNTTSV
jgi:hypothetical protein